MVAVMSEIRGDARILVYFIVDGQPRAKEFGSLLDVMLWRADHTHLVINEICYWGTDDSKAVEIVHYCKGDATCSDNRGRFVISVIGEYGLITILLRALIERRAKLARKMRREAKRPPLMQLPPSRRERRGTWRPGFRC